MDLATALVETAVGAATLAIGWPLVRAGASGRRSVGALLALAGVAAIAHAVRSVLG